MPIMYTNWEATLDVCLGLGQARRFVLSDKTRLVGFCQFAMFSLGYFRGELYSQDEVSFVPLDSTLSTILPSLIHYTTHDTLRAAAIVLVLRSCFCFCLPNPGRTTDNKRIMTYNTYGWMWTGECIKDVNQ